MKMSPFAEAIYKQKYAHPGEDWTATTNRVVAAVTAAAPVLAPDTLALADLIEARKFLPGGRYLYASGRPFHQTQNCFDGATQVITDRGVFSLKELAGTKAKVLTHKGRWMEAEFRSFGQQLIWNLTLANGLVIRTTENHRWIQTCGGTLPTRTVEEVLFAKPAPIDMEVEAVRHGIVFGDGHLIKSGNYSAVQLCGDKKQELVRYFEDKSVTVTLGGGAQADYPSIRKYKAGWFIGLLPAEYKTLPLQCTPAYARGFVAGLLATDGCVPEGGSVQIHCEGMLVARDIAAIAVLGGCVVNSVKVVSEVSPFTGEERELCCISIKPHTAPVVRADQVERLSKRRLRKNFRMTVEVESAEATGVVEEVFCAVQPEDGTFTLANGIVTGNCLLLRAEDSREGWADLMQKATMALMTGAGIGIDYSDVRPACSPVSKTGGFATGPCSLVQMVNEAGRHIMQGGARRSAIWGGLRWNHPDVFKFIALKNWSDEIKAMKAKDFNAYAPLDGTNISVILDKAFFDAYKAGDKHAKAVYWKVVRQMLENGEPGFSVDYHNPRESLRNACCEITSEDDSDICNLGSLNMAQFATLDEFKEAVRLGTIFLLAGTLYSDVPYAKVAETRTKNRRLGLGLMGMHEWLLKRGKAYGPDAELAEWLEAYRTISTATATATADAWGISRPVATRAIAPTGSLSILAECTSGIEPLFCVAYQRRYRSRDGINTEFQYVIDPSAQRLIEAGVDPDSIEDAYALAEDVERRVAFQAWVQQYVDHAISSTINLPAWGSEHNQDGKQVQEFGRMLMKYLPQLRGITVYPDASRGGQPLVPVAYSTDAGKVGQVFVEGTDVCDISGKGGSCGS